MKQKTLSKPVSFYGKGLHLGKKTHMMLLPAPEDTGVIFHLMCGNRMHVIKACIENVIRKPYCTAITNGEVVIRTTEHLMAAFYCSEITNAYVVLSKPEIPLLDGSAKYFIEAIKQVGVKEQESNQKILVVKKSFRMQREDQDGFLEMHPSRDFSVDMTILDPSFQNWQGMATPKNLSSEIASARTFGPMLGAILAKTFTRFWKNPIACGIDGSNLIMIHKDESYIKGGLRFKDEHVRHRTLDFIGDLFLTGFIFQAHVVGHNTSHWLNYCFLKSLLMQSEYFEK